MPQAPKLVQAALLFDRPKPFDLHRLVEQFRAISAASGVMYSQVFDTKPGKYYRLFGGNVMITIEYLDGPADPSAFEATLASPFTRTANKDARAHLARHRSHVLVNVHQGIFTPNTQITSLLEQLNVGDLIGGASTREYRQRLALCGEIALLAHEMGRASLVHWTASDHLLQGEVFSRLAIEPAPSLLHIHPLPFQAAADADGRERIEIKTFGAAHFIDRELHVAASPLPFAEAWTLISCFLNVATAQKGYIIPDGDTFGDATNSLSCRVSHVAAGTKSGPFDGPLYRLEPLYSRDHGFMSPDFVPRERAFDDRTVPADVANSLGDAKDEAVEEWRTKRKMAEGVGGSFKVWSKAPPAGPPVRPFGRRTTPPGA